MKFNSKNKYKCKGDRGTHIYFNNKQCMLVKSQTISFLLSFFIINFVELNKVETHRNNFYLELF